ncbi:MAG: hypothetical protein ACP5QG_03180 [candidate division WOR-3 bacterium]
MLPAMLGVVDLRVWTESSHSDFSDGAGYCYLGGDSATSWWAESLRTWEMGSRLYLPANGGLRIIGQELDTIRGLNSYISLWGPGPLSGIGSCQGLPTPGAHPTSVDSMRVFGNIPGGTRVEAWAMTGRGLLWDRWVRINGDGRPSEPVASRDRLQYRLVIGLDYRTTTFFTIDSVKLFYRTGSAFEEAGEEGTSPGRKTDDYEHYHAARRLVEWKTGPVAQRHIFQC